MMTFLYVLGVSALGVGLVIFSYLDRIYRELGRVHKGRVREHLELFEAEVEPHFRLERARASGRLTLEGKVRIYPSDAFLKRNINRTPEQHLAHTHGEIARFKELGIPVRDASV